MPTQVELEALERQERELMRREAELYRRTARLVRAASERAAQLETRERALARRESSLAALAAELTAEHERVTALRTQVLRDLERLERSRLQAAPRAFAVPAVDDGLHEDEAWWDKMLGREPEAVEAR